METQKLQHPIRAPEAYTCILHHANRETLVFLFADVDILM